VRGKVDLEMREQVRAVGLDPVPAERGLDGLGHDIRARAVEMLGQRCDVDADGGGGQYRTIRTPYLREIMDALSPSHPAQRISFMKAAQVGATEAGNNWIGFVIHHAPGPMLAVLPTVEMAKRTSRGRLDPLIAESPALRERVNLRRAAERAGRAAEWLDMLERNNTIQRQMLDAASRRPRDRDDLAPRMREGRF